MNNTFDDELVRGVGPTGATPPALEVLLVEDDPGDALMIGDALAEVNADATLHVVADGAKALAFLHREDGYEDAPRPTLILLDLNLPGLDGRDVLAQVKADESLRAIPVVVLTCSQAEVDIARSYGLHANAYITKPMDAADFANVVHRVNEFFTTVVKLPR